MISPKHYIKSAFKTFKRNKWYTSLMVCSLAAGMFCFVLAQLYVNYEFSRNKNHESADLVYQIKLRFGNEGRHTYPLLSYVEQLENLFPNIEAVSMVDQGNNEYVSADNENYVKQETPFYVNNDFFEVFTFPLKYGNVESALSNDRNVVISSRLAEVLYPGVDPVGKDFFINEKGVFQVGGVLEEVSKLSVMNPGLLFTRGQWFQENPKKSNMDVLFTHIKLKQNQPQDELEAELYEAWKPFNVDERINGVYSEKLKDAYWGGTHFNYGTEYYSLMGLDRDMINIMSYIGLAVLLCAFVGYLSLYLSISLRRSKEIGIRKVNGAVKSDIRIQILSESVCYAFLALLITIISLEMTSSYFSELFQVPIALDLIQPLTLLGLIGFTLVTGFSAGLYPAFVVAKMNPIKILSGFNSPLGGGFKLKRILLVFQLTISGVLVFSVLTLQMHVKKMNQFDFGYDNTDLLAFEVGEKNVKNNFLAVREAIAKMPGVSQISGGPFPYNINGYADVNYAAADTLLTESAGRIYVALDFLSLTNVPIISGSHFGGLPSGELSQVCIVNEAFALAIGRDILGESITIDGKLKRIVGISKNYTVWGISSPEGVSQVFLPVDEPKYHSLLVKVDPLQRKNVLAGLEDIWRTYEPILEPKVSELDVAIDESIERQSKITSLFGFLALVVLVLSLMNLFGVSLMYARSKLKNISIRRILGAETFELFSKLIRPFLYALLISLFISIPIGYWLMEGYLADFAVRIDLSFMQGLMVSVIMLLAILLVAGVQMIRTSNVDPVAVLKDQ